MVKERFYKTEVVPRCLTFKRPAGTSRGVYTTRKLWEVRIRKEDEPSVIGIGECAPLPDLSCDYGVDYEITLSKACLDLEHEGYVDTESLRHYPSILFGLETAMRHYEQGGWRHYDTSFSQGQAGIPINGLIWMGDYKYMLEQVEEKMKEGFRCVKLKIGAIDFDRELSLLKHIRTHFSAKEIELRVDANGAFTPPEAMDKLKNSRVAVFGIGGVGGYVCEALVRSGIGAFDLIDDDKVCLTNLNRQIIATRKTVGKYKVDVMKERMLEINPDVNVRIHKCFFLPENADEFPFDEYDYVVDAVDTVTAKIELVMKSQAMNVPIISSMGAGNKLDASAFKVADIYKTQMCPLAKVMRRELKKRHVKKLKVVYSEEKPTRPIEDMAISCRNHCICPPGAEHKCTERRDIPGSVAFVPSVVGLIIAGEVVKDLCAK